MSGIKPRHKRLFLMMLGLATFGLAAWLVLSALQRNLVFFFTPSQVFAGEAPRDSHFRIGGMVEPGSVRRQPDGLTVNFVVTDMAQRMPVTYRGILPDLFREEKGVVAQGRLNRDGLFIASQVLAKHDENYMPPEAAEALRKGKEAARTMASDTTAERK